MSTEVIADKELNLQGEVCPYTFVLGVTKLDNNDWQIVVQKS